MTGVETADYWLSIAGFTLGVSLPWVVGMIQILLFLERNLK